MTALLIILRCLVPGDVLLQVLDRQLSRSSGDTEEAAPKNRRGDAVDRVVGLLIDVQDGRSVPVFEAQSEHALGDMAGWLRIL